jgi:hypothetical protein
MVRFTTSLAFVALAAALGSAAVAQTASPARPSFDGIWTNASGTRLERARTYTTLIVPKAQADAVEQRAIANATASGAATDPNAGAPKDGNATAGYNAYWTDPGFGLMKIRGEARSSYITDPEDGRIPWKDRSKSLKHVIQEGIEYQSGNGAYPGVEELPLRERCLISQSDEGGPIMLSGLYNNIYEFHLTADHLIIEVEMVHDLRIYPIYASAAEAKARHKPAVIRPWLGDSVAWWEGDTLVAETRNVNPIQEAHTATPLSAEGSVTERFTRIAPGELLYQFRVEDPVHYTQPWSGEYSYKPAQGGLYEYACHEGNYSVPGILRGARMKETGENKASSVMKTPVANMEAKPKR